ncbi:hypothetical protein LAZ67_11003212 [Cordylochernes scorpioides]|uniref:Uncharacterized protein n=1 Tax=Cordylochernes scorpioides TaxID=51811 RepID=A0ABY6L0G4_9ARAC|nr:hypothetical protein LAZ67_11003212 [Cordylochernes scorpioides]
MRGDSENPSHLSPRSPVMIDRCPMELPVAGVAELLNNIVLINETHCFRKPTWAERLKVMRKAKEAVRQFMSGNSAKKRMNPRPPYTKSFDRGDLVMLAVPKTEGYSNVYGPFRVEARVSDVNFRYLPLLRVSHMVSPYLRPSMPSSTEDRGGSSKSPTVQDETLANLSTSPDVLLPTLRVTLKGNRTEKTARAIIDTGSQRSYILHSTAMEMEYEQSRREFFRHSLFGGSSTDVVEHEVYTIHLSDINNSYRCEFEALGQPLICGSIPPVCPRSLLEGSEELDVSDLMRDRIEVLIGADIAGRLLTDDQRRISSGLVAIRTKLGWTVMGKIPPTEVRDDISSLCVTTLLSLDLENLWKLDAIGVSDAEFEKKTQSLQAEMEEHFAHTTTRDIEGRYEGSSTLGARQGKDSFE